MKFFINTETVTSRKTYILPIVAIAYMLLVRMRLVFSYNIDLDGAEFTFVHYIQQLMLGHPLYMDPAAHPYSAVIYPPGYIYLVYGVCKMMNWDAVADVYSIFIAGRLISLGFVLLGLYFLDKFIRKRNGSPALRLYGAAAFLILISGHAYAVRPDCMKIAFFIAFLCYYIEYFYFEARKKYLFLAVLFAVLSVSAKQDAIVYVGLIQGVNWLCLRNRASFFTGVISLFLIALMFLGYHLISGKYCLESLFPFNFQVMTSLNGSYNVIVILLNLIRYVPFVVLLLNILIHIKYLDQAPLLKMISISGLAATIITSLMLLRPGSYLNYTYELSVIIVFVLLLILPVTHSKWMRNGLSWYFGLLFLVNIIINSYSWWPSKEIKFEQQYHAYYKMRDTILATTNKDDKIFMPEMKSCLFLADRNVVYGQEYHLSREIYCIIGLRCTSHLLWNSSEDYDRLFTDGSIRYLLISDKKEPLEVIRQYYPNYHLAKKIEGFELYEFTH